MALRIGVRRARLAARMIWGEMMSDVNWDTPARLHERDDGGSDMFYDFKTLRSGSLAELVGHVMALPPAERQRVVIDSASGSIAIQDIAALAARPDFPGR